MLGRQEIVIKSRWTEAVCERSVFGGATIDPEGRVVLVLDVSRLTTREYQETMSIAQDSSVAAIEDATGHSELKASAPLGVTVATD